jgi:hypothetical protein
LTVTAKHDYRLIVTRGGRTPSVFADPRRADSIEIVGIASGEVVLFWDCAPREASRVAREIRRDLARLDAAEFLARWSETDSLG